MRTQRTALRRSALALATSATLVLGAGAPVALAAPESTMSPSTSMPSTSGATTPGATTTTPGASTTTSASSASTLGSCSESTFNSTSNSSLDLSGVTSILSAFGQQNTASASNGSSTDQVEQVIGKFDQSSLSDKSTKGSAAISAASSSSGGSNLYTSVAQAIQENGSPQSLVSVGRDGTKTAIAMARIASQVDPSKISTIATSGTTIAASATRASAGDPTAIASIVQSSAQLGGTVLIQFADIMRMWQATSDIPQLKDLLTSTDPNGTMGKAILAKVPKEQRTKELISAMSAVAALGRALAAIDYASIASVSGTLAVGLANGNLTCLTKVPELMTTAFTSFAAAAKALTETNPGAVGNVIQNTALGGYVASTQTGAQQTGTQTSGTTAPSTTAAPQN